MSRDSLGYVDGMSAYQGYFAPGSVDPIGTNRVECPSGWKEVHNPAKDLGDEIGEWGSTGKDLKITDKYVDKTTRDWGEVMDDVRKQGAWNYHYAGWDSAPMYGEGVWAHYVKYTSELMVEDRVSFLDKTARLVGPRAIIPCPADQVTLNVGYAETESVEWHWDAGGHLDLTVGSPGFNVTIGGAGSGGGGGASGTEIYSEISYNMAKPTNREWLVHTVKVSALVHVEVRGRWYPPYASGTAGSDNRMNLGSAMDRKDIQLGHLICERECCPTDSSGD